MNCNYSTTRQNCADLHRAIGCGQSRFKHRLAGGLCDHTKEDWVHVIEWTITLMRQQDRRRFASHRADLSEAYPIIEAAIYVGDGVGVVPVSAWPAHLTGHDYVRWGSAFTRCRYGRCYYIVGTEDALEQWRWEALRNKYFSTIMHARDVADPLGPEHTHATIWGGE